MPTYKPTGNNTYYLRQTTEHHPVDVKVHPTCETYGNIEDLFEAIKGHLLNPFGCAIIVTSSLGMKFVSEEDNGKCDCCFEDK